MTLDSFSFTHQGGRSGNQDSVGIVEGPDCSLYVVADGLGGHLHGEQASACVVSTLTEREDPCGDDLSAWLQQRIAQANGRLLELQEQRRSNMKSTVTALVIKGKSACWANVGDCRLYYLHNRAIEKITADHSVAYKKYLSGEITRAQIATDEDQSSLLRTLGNPNRNQPDLHAPEHPLTPGDGFLICSDGMWEHILDDEILIDFLKADCAETWAKLLLQRAMDRFRPGNDNLSVITVMVNP